MDGVIFGGRAGWVPFDGNPRPDGRARAAGRGGAAGAVADLFRLRLGDDVRREAAAAIKVAFKAAFETVAGTWRLVVGLMAAMGAAWLIWRLTRRRRHPLVAAYTVLEGDGRREVLDAYARFARKGRRLVPERGQAEPIAAYFARLAVVVPSLGAELAWLRGKAQAAAYGRSAPSAAAADEAKRRFVETAQTIRGLA